MFGKVIYTKGTGTDNFIAQELADLTQSAFAILRTLFDPRAEGLSLFADLLMHSILIIFFSANLSSPQYLLLRLCSRFHDTMH